MQRSADLATGGRLAERCLPGQAPEVHASGLILRARMAKAEDTQHVVLQPNVNLDQEFD